MFKPTFPAPQKKSDFGASQQNIDPEVMNLVKRKGKPKESPQIEKAVEQLRQVLAQNNIDPKVVVQAGDLAYKAFRDPTQYELAKDMLIKNGIMTAEEVKQGAKETILGTAMIAGKLAEKIIGTK
jgi:chaperonin GroEL (HSP60 family)